MDKNNRDYNFFHNRAALVANEDIIGDQSSK